VGAGNGMGQDFTSDEADAGAHFTRFHITKVQMLTRAGVPAVTRTLLVGSAPVTAIYKHIAVAELLPCSCVCVCALLLCICLHAAAALLLAMYVCGQWCR
jgi:hypothetical protein